MRAPNRLLPLALVLSSAAACSSGGVDPLAVIDDVSNRMETLLNANPDATPAELEALFAGQPGIVETGVEEEGAWAHFADGQVLVLLDDRLATVQPPRKDGKAWTDPDPFPWALPSTGKVEILNAMGTVFSPYWRDFRPWFEQARYRAHEAPATVEQLKQLSAGDTSVLYLDVHSGPFKLPGGARSFVVGTSVPVSPAGELAYADDLRDRGLVHLSVKHDRLPNGKFTVARVYGFTPTFVRHHLRFPQNSLVVIDGCRSDSALLKQAFLDQGASLYGGWTNKVGDYISERALKFFFDRLLGTNSYEAEKLTPPQRAFNYLEVMAEMTRHGYHQGTLPKGGTTEFAVTPTSFFSVGLLAPSLRHLSVSAETLWGPVPAPLILLGSFGSTPGTVLFNDSPLSCRLWNDIELVCDGPSGPGTVVVETNGTPSNPRRITEWRGSFTLTGKYGCGDGTGHGLVAKLRADVRFRADAASHREHSGELPVTDAVAFSAERDTKYFAFGSGECSYRRGSVLEVTRWSGGGQVPLVGAASGIIDGQNRRIRINLDLSSEDVIQFSTTCDGSPCGSGSSYIRWTTGDDGFQDSLVTDGPADYLLPVFDLPLDDGWNGGAGSRTGPSTADSDVALSWTRLSAASAPDPEAAR